MQNLKKAYNEVYSSRSRPPIDVVDCMMHGLIGGDIGPTVKGSSGAYNAASYHLRLGGQRIRARLALDACNKLGVAEVNAVALAACVELIHNASLVHDDLQDKDVYRRGAKSVWAKYGEDIAVCTGDLLLSAAYGALAAVTCTHLLPLILKRVHQKILCAVRGQCADLDRPQVEQFDFEAYRDLVLGKSGALISLPLELALIVGDAQQCIPSAALAADNFAIAYQIHDDLEDFEADTNHNQSSRSNVLFVIKRQFPHVNPQEHAIAYAQAKLSEARPYLDNLPCNSGYVLSQLSHELSKKLDIRKSR